MISLSIYNGHNAAICIRKDKEILLNWELERFTRIKHDYGFNQEFLEKSLSICNLKMEDLDVILTNSLDYSRKLPWKVPSTADNKIQVVEFRINNKPAYAINHHLAHVASSYFTSPFDDSTVITYDAGGDNANFSIATAKGSKIISFSSQSVLSLASYWSGITLNNYRMKRLHEWDPGSGAGKIMGLASYGKATNELENLIKNTMAEPRKKYYTDPHSRAFNNDEDLSDVSSQKSQDVAASIQSFTEKFLRDTYNHAYKYLPNDNLCMAGGIALNCVANTKVKSDYKNLHVPPFPNDSGLAAGMSLFHWHHILNNNKNFNFFSPYLGPKYSKREVLKSLEKSNFSFKPFLIDDLVSLLCNREIICLAKGQSESGPRALGHRSIICLPDIKDVRNFLNFKIKNREWYRPYAPIIIDKYVDDILEDYLPDSPYMSTSGTIKEKWRDKLSGVNHIDNSTRPQILRKVNEPFVYDLIERIYEITGIPVLLNTSFNLQEPIVETPDQALNTFERFKEIKYMVLHDFIVYKSKG